MIGGMYILLSKLKRIPLDVIGVCIYIGAFAFPFQFDFPLLLLALFIIINQIQFFKRNTINNSLLVYSVLLFISGSILSIIFSVDVSRSIKLSLPLLPGILLYFSINQFNSKKYIHMLYITLSTVGMGLSIVLLLTAINYQNMTPSVWVEKLNCSILVVPNDITFLSIIIPFPITILLLKPRKSIILFISAVIILMIAVPIAFQSRTATLTMLLSIVLTTAFLRPKLLPLFILGFLALLFTFDTFYNYSLIFKFKHILDPRIAYWAVALSMFFESPIFGQGPHSFGAFYPGKFYDLHLPDWLPFDNRIIHWPHNLYMEVLSGQGLLGIISFILILYFSFVYAMRGLRNNSIETRQLIVAPAAAFISFCFAAFLELSFIRLWVVIIFFVIIGIISNLSVHAKPTNQMENRGYEKH